MVAKGIIETSIVLKTLTKSTLKSTVCRILNLVETLLVDKLLKNFNALGNRIKTVNANVATKQQEVIIIKSNINIAEVDNESQQPPRPIEHFKQYEATTKHLVVR